MSLTERQIEGINSFWNMTISHWDKAGRSEFNKDFPHLLVLIACTLGDMEKIMWLQEEYGREEITRLANTDIHRESHILQLLSNALNFGNNS